MAYFVERRKYQRCTSIMCKTMMSVDGARWDDVDICDISAGGLKFLSKNDFDLTTKLHFNVYFYNLLSEFNIRFNGYLIRKDNEKDYSLYSVRFMNVNKHHEVQMDELIKSKVSVKNANDAMVDDGIYTFLVAPRIKAGGIRVSGYR
jgi:c-di-GMP-binding flagellar brake protein YcgR